MFVAPRRAVLGVLAVFVLTAPLHALGNEASQADGGSRTDDAPAIEESVEVVGSAAVIEAQDLSREKLQTGRFTNIGQALESMPGIAAVRRAANMTEPVVRGLGWERVQTEVNGTPLHGACPARMDPPVCTVPTTSVSEARVSKGLTSVSRGPGGTGGRLRLSTTGEARADGENRFGGTGRLGWDAARDGAIAGVGFDGSQGRLAYRFGGELVDHDDYESADGISVPASQEEASAFASLDIALAKGQRLWTAATFMDADEIDYPALPMNADTVDTRLYQVGYELARPGALLRQFSVSLGVAEVEHVMSNRGKPNRAAMEAETGSSADTRSLRLSSSWRVGPRAVLSVGADALKLERDALRERVMVASGMRFLDHLWPEVSQDDLGAFAEYDLRPTPDWRVRVGARVDRVESEAAAADDPSLMGRSVRENYAAFYGDGALDTERRESLVSGNVLVERSLPRGVTLHGGAGLVSRAANLTERYFAFAPAPGGFVVGNPTLDAERKLEIEAGAELTTRALRLSASVYHYDVSDYIYPALLDIRDINMDGTPDRLRGFRNVEARLYGIDAAVAWTLDEHWIVPLSLAWVRAENESEGRPLPEIPPLEIGAGARYRFSGRFPGWAELGARIVDDQTRIDETFGENATESFEVWHLRARIRVLDLVDLELAVENLLDEEYNEHLTREAFLAVGGLAAGDDVPQPGRSFLVTTHLSF